jgi:hypothetical protein
MNLAESDRGSQTGFRAFLTAHALAAIVLAFAVGLFSGWLLPGRLLSPVPVAGGVPGDLAPDWQREWVQLVADDYARTRDVERALGLLDDMSAKDLSSAMSALASEGRSAVQQHTAAALAEALKAMPASGAAASGPQEAGAAVGSPQEEEPDSDMARITRVVAAALLLLAACAAVVLGWSWLRWHRGEQGSDGQAGGRPGARTDGRAVGGSDDSASAPPEPDHSRADPDVGAQGGPPWRPLRIDLGKSTTVTYEPAEGRLYQTWLVDDEQGDLVGGVGLRSQSIGRAQVLELWFFRRGDEGLDENTPTVTLVAPAAQEDGVLLARLGDRKVATVWPGERVVLTASDLELVADIAAAQSGTGDERAGLGTVTLVLTPRRTSFPGEQAAVDPPGLD